MNELYFILFIILKTKIAIPMSVSLPRPPWTKLGRRIEAQVRKALYDYNMVDECRSVAVALSGGKDSLTLLAMLAAVSGRGFPKFDLHAIHIGGKYTCGAGVHLAHLRRTCEEIGAHFHLRESKQDLDTLECYGCSRERRRLLFQAAREAGADVLAFGHHRDDNAQTLLLNLCQKASFEGMLPKLTMYTYGMTIIRPLTYVSEQDIRTFSQQEGFARVMCRCPVGQHSMRRKAEELLEELEATFPGVRENLSRAGLLHGTRKAAQRPKLKEDSDPS